MTFAVLSVCCVCNSEWLVQAVLLRAESLALLFCAQNSEGKTRDCNMQVMFVIKMDYAMINQ